MRKLACGGRKGRGRNAVYKVHKPIPTTITQLRKAMPGWNIEYHTNFVYTFGSQKTSHHVQCYRKVSWQGALFTVPMVKIRLTNKDTAVAAAYAAMKTMEACDA